jgi:hypothetical protein
MEEEMEELYIEGLGTTMAASRASVPVRVQAKRR